MNDCLTDMHCHLDFAPNGDQVAAELSEAGVELFTNTVAPDEWEASRRAFTDVPSVVVGYGWHPWWVTKDSSPSHLMDLLEEFDPSALGEVGLDFNTKHAGTKDEQVAIFKSFAVWASKNGGKLLSVHAVRSADITLEILKNAGVFDTCTCIYHWFSGTSQDLRLALDAGCYFSINPRMLASKRGREYVKQIPAERLLLESDLPGEPGAVLAASDITDSLQASIRKISEIKGADCALLINETARSLLRSTRD